MKKRIRILAFVLVMICVAATLCACGDDQNQDYVYFQNDTGVKVVGVYISSVTADTWGDPLNLATVSVGAKIHFDPAKALPDGPGTTYDVGVLDEKDMVYEIYEVTLNLNDVISVRGDGEDAILTVTDAQGGVTEYYGWIYPFEE